MSAWAGTAKASASVINRSFLITPFIPPKILRLGNGKMTGRAEKLLETEPEGFGFGVVLGR